MILVTVGTDLPFDRMVKVVDRWAGERGRDDVFAQIGEGGWKPRNIPHAEFLDPVEFKKRLAEAKVIVAHAGMGSILTSLHHGKPILVMPKRASLGEQRNEHQLATARRMEELGKVDVAWDEEELAVKLDAIGSLTSRGSIEPYASGGLIEGLAAFIREGRVPDGLAGGATTAQQPDTASGVFGEIGSNPALDGK